MGKRYSCPLQAGQSRDVRYLYLILSALLVFFTVYSSPHRVHHSFEVDLETSCLVLSIAKNCHLRPASPIKLPYIQVVIEVVALSLEVWIPHHITLAFLRRAPPTLLSS